VCAGAATTGGHQADASRGAGRSLSPTCSTHGARCSRCACVTPGCPAGSGPRGAGRAENQAASTGIIIIIITIITIITIIVTIIIKVDAQTQKQFETENELMLMQNAKKELAAKQVPQH